MSAFGPGIGQITTLRGLNPVMHGTLTVSTTALSLANIVAFADRLKSSGGPTSSTTPLRAALVSVETEAVKFTMDGTTPGAVVGHHLAVNDYWPLWGHKQIQGFQVVRQGALDARIHVTLFE